MMTPGRNGDVVGAESKAAVTPSARRDDRSAGAVNTPGRDSGRNDDRDRDGDRDRAARGDLAFPPIVSAAAGPGPRSRREGSSSSAEADAQVQALSADALQGMLPKQRKGWGSPLDVGKIRAAAGGSGSERSDDRDAKKPSGGADNAGGDGGSYRRPYNDESDGDFEELDSGLDMLGADGDVEVENEREQERKACLRSL